MAEWYTAIPMTGHGELPMQKVVLKIDHDAEITNLRIKLGMRDLRIDALEVALRDVCYALPSKASVAKRQALNILVPNAGLTAETPGE